MFFGWQEGNPETTGELKPKHVSCHPGTSGTSSDLDCQIIVPCAIKIFKDHSKNEIGL